MSSEDVAVVRSYNEFFDGQDLAARIRKVLEGIDRDETEAVVRAAHVQLLEDPITRHLHPDVVWDLSGAGETFFGVREGLRELARYWVEWAALWESYVYHVVEYRDLGDWVLTVADVKARSSQGMDLAMRVYQLWRVDGGLIATMRAFLAEEDALAAAEPEAFGL